MIPRLKSIKRILLSIGHKATSPNRDPGAVNSITNETENSECTAIAKIVSDILTKNNIKNILLPDETLTNTINRINGLSNKDSDWCIELHKDSFHKYNPKTMSKRMGVYYHPTSANSELIAVQMKKIFIDCGADSTSWARPDTMSNHGGLSFIRRTKPLAHLIEAGFIQDNNDDASDQFYAKTIATAIIKLLSDANAK